MPGLSLQTVRTQALQLAQIRTIINNLSLARELLVLLLFADVAFMVFHALHSFTPHLPDFYSNITYERSAAETVQFLKEFWVVLSLVWLTLVRSWPHAAWAVLFGFIMVDDVRQLHEQAGDRIADELGFSGWFGLRAVDYGELAFLAIAGVILLALVAFAYWRGNSSFRATSRHLLAFLVLFSFFGGFVDAIHGGTEDDFGHHPLALVEDGGELVIMSALCAYLVGALRASEDPPAPSEPSA